MRVEVLQDARAVGAAAVRVEQAPAELGVTDGDDLLVARPVRDLLEDGVAEQRVQRALQPEQEADGPGRGLRRSSSRRRRSPA